MAREQGLSATFLAEIPAEDRAGVARSQGLAESLAVALARGRASFAKLRVDDATFVRHLARAFRSTPDDCKVTDLVVEDLFLACACVNGARGAADALVARHGPVIKRIIERTAGKSNTDEIFQALLADLVVGSVRSGPEIGNYAGRAPIARWLEVVAQRASVRWLRSERARANAAGRAAVEPGASSATPTETALFRARYRRDFEEAVREALARAPKKDRGILRLYLVGNVSVERIGKMLGVSQSTASRWLARARDTVFGDVKAILKQRSKISSNEIATLADLLDSRLDLSLSQALKSVDDERIAER